MLPGLTSREIGRLRMSVGYGTHKRGRPLSPVEVGMLLRRARSAGASLQECAEGLKLSADQLSRFIQVSELPADIRHLVGFGQSAESKIGFTTAVHLARVSGGGNQRAVAGAILEQGLRTGEVRQVVQLQRRSGRTIQDCLQEVLAIRPTVDRHYVFIGTVGDERMEAALAELTQSDRNAVLRSGIDSLGLQGISGRLGPELFTLVGDERLHEHLVRQGKETIEAHLRAHILAKVTGR